MCVVFLRGVLTAVVVPVGRKVDFLTTAVRIDEVFFHAHKLVVVWFYSKYTTR